MGRAALGSYSRDVARIRRVGMCGDKLSTSGPAHWQLELPVVEAFTPGALATQPPPPPPPPEAPSSEPDCSIRAHSEQPSNRLALWKLKRFSLCKGSPDPLVALHRLGQRPDPGCGSYGDSLGIWGGQVGLQIPLGLGRLVSWQPRALSSQVSSPGSRETQTSFLLSPPTQQPIH